MIVKTKFHKWDENDEECKTDDYIESANISIIQSETVEYKKGGEFVLDEITIFFYSQKGDYITQKRVLAPASVYLMENGKTVDKYELEYKKK